MLYGINGATAVAVDGTLSILNGVGGTLYSIDVPGTAGDLMPVTTDGTVVINGSTIDTTTVNFVAKGRGQLPSVSVPPRCKDAGRRGAGAEYRAADAAARRARQQHDGHRHADRGNRTLAAGNDFGNATIEQIDAQTLVVAGTLGAVERSLQSLTYQGAAADPTPSRSPCQTTTGRRRR